MHSMHKQSKAVHLPQHALLFLLVTLNVHTGAATTKQHRSNRDHSLQLACECLELHQADCTIVIRVRTVSHRGQLRGPADQPE